MSARAQSLVAQFTAKHEEFARLVRSLSPDDWQRTPPGEARTVGVIAYHTAQGYFATLALAQVIASGEALPAFAPEWMNAMNAQQAAEHAGASQGEVLALLDSNYGAVAAALGALSDEHLAAPRDFFGHTTTAEQGIAYLMLHHIMEHMASIQAVLAAIPA
jgi:hypothetical protein